jgi:hypothetical protein
MTNDKQSLPLRGKYQMPNAKSQISNTVQEKS